MEKPAAPTNATRNHRGSGGNALAEFFRTEHAGAIVLLAATILALLTANSPLYGAYSHLLHADIVLRLGSWQLAMSLLNWIDDGLMVLFFFVVGLEIRREIVVGELSDPRKAFLPIAAALGGMVVPALIYLAINHGGAGARGWGIPMATDIAFALGALALLGKRLPDGLRLFLAALAIADDIGAIIVIAVFYASGLSLGWLGLGLGVFLLLLGLNRMHVDWLALYFALGFVVWVAFLKSGVHPTVAGVLMAFAIPANAKMISRSRAANAASSVKIERVEHALNPVATYVVLPMFAFANAGVHLAGVDPRAALGQPVVLGIAAGMILGKTLGITLASLGTVRLGITELPSGVTPRHILGVAMLGGVGFTMSMFIANLAFGNESLASEAKLAILVSSLIAGMLGCAWLFVNSKMRPE